jgi:transposase
MTRDALLLELEATRAELVRERAELARERTERARQEAEVERLAAENLELKHRIDVMARRMFGRSSERLAPDQYLLAFEAARAEAERALEEDARETALGEETERTPRPRRVRPSEKKAQRELPVRTVAVEPDAEDRACGCGATKERIGEETSERLEHVPASTFILRTVRGKWACAGCESGVTIAPLPPQGLERSVAGPGLVAHVVTDKYANHLPTYRQAEIFAREGVDLPRSTLGDVIRGAAERLEPLARRVMGSVLESRVVVGVQKTSSA